MAMGLSPSNATDKVSLMTRRQTWLNVGGLEVLIALLELACWLNTGEQAMPGLLDLSCWTGPPYRV